MKSRLITSLNRCILLLLVAVVLQLIVESWTIHRLSHQNTLLEQLESGKIDMTSIDLSHASDNLKLAYANSLLASKNYPGAQKLLLLLEKSDDTEIAEKATFNLGNLFLRQAIEKVSEQKMALAPPYVSLARSRYRNVLATNPSMQDAKYNLEVTQQLLPHLPRVSMDADDEDTAQKEDALWTRVPGFPRGLP